MNISPKTKLFDLLKEYPELEEKIMDLAPPFKNLKNPVLRKTVGKLATVEKVAQIGNLKVNEFLNILREAVGLEVLETEVKSKTLETPMDFPGWISGDPVHIVNGTEMLERGEHPLQLVNGFMQEISPGQYILLQTNFAPLPLIDAMQKQGYKVYHNESKDEDHLTFIGK